LTWISEYFKQEIDPDLYHLYPTRIFIPSYVNDF
jgi:hypothetical protein